MIALQTIDYERRGGEGNNTQRFSCFYHSSQKCKSVLHVILSLDQWANSSIFEGSNYLGWNWWTKFWLHRFYFFRPWILMSNTEEIDRNSIIAHLLDSPTYWSDIVWSIEMPTFDCLEDGYIIFIQQMRYKNSHKQRLHK